MERMRKRGREDDTDNVIQRRIKNYESETVPVINQYKEEGKMIRVNGFQSIEKVTGEIMQKLSQYQR